MSPIVDTHVYNTKPWNGKVIDYLELLFIGTYMRKWYEQ